MAIVTLYTSNFCGYCSAAKRYLTERGASITEINLSGDDEGRIALRDRTGLSTVPQIFIGTTHVGGYTDMVALDRAGGLAPLLQG